jgi:hypothetical protein
LSPALNTGTTIAFFHSCGMQPILSDSLNRDASGFLKLDEQCFRTRAGISSGPVALLGSSFLSFLLITFA